VSGNRNLAAGDTTMLCYFHIYNRLHGGSSEMSKLNGRIVIHYLRAQVTRDVFYIRRPNISLQAANNPVSQSSIHKTKNDYS
jgi:hypothetical protein